MAYTVNNVMDISGRFIIITSIICIGISGLFYINEKRFIDNSVIFIARISAIKSEPRKRVLQMRVIDETAVVPVLFVTVPFWDKRRIDELIRVRIGDETASQVKLDEFLYLHKVSISILSSYFLLLGIVSGVYFYRKTDNSSY